ncbi:MAG: energy-coupled thiamine transporter ThiT [Bacilli bacterium]|nr:energy-coupled thiamine transporter ThiT [Bacilli bacterium]
MSRTNLITEVAVFVAFALVLEVFFTALSIFIPILQLPYGGRISLAMLPLFIVSHRHGIKWGIYAGVSYGLLNLMLDAKLYHWASLFTDYVFAFGVLGLSAFGRKLLGDTKAGLIVGIGIGSLLRLFSHFVSGVLLFGGYAGDYGFENVYWYSFVYNSYYVLPSMILCMIVGAALLNRIRTSKM